MNEVLVDATHPMSVIILAALREGKALREDTPNMMARAVKCVLAIEPSMSVSDAYILLNRLWVR